MIIKQNNKKTKIKVEFVNKKPNNKLRYENFTGKNGEIAFEKDKIFVGINDAKSKGDWREIGFQMIQKIKNKKIKEISIELPEKSQEIIEGMYLGSYEFDKYKTKKEKTNLKKIHINCKKDIRNTIRIAKNKIKAQFLTRDWVNTTPEDANSKTISEYVQNIFKDSKNIKVTIYDEKDLKRFGMNGHLAVNRASRHEAKTIKIEYIPENNKHKNIVLIGKGLTYDSGGLSIKPSQHMTTMKIDKAGAMTVLGIMKGLSKIGTNNKVTAYMALAENMIDGSAYKPDDVITMMNKKTVHIENTDAEGRIVLFDNICLAQKENKKIDEIYTFATLTGSAIMQFGNETAGMVGFNEKMKKTIKKTGEKEDEIFMNAEFHKYMLNGVNDDLADLTNLGTPGMGCQKAGLFLTKALKNKNKNKFLHLDIAGPAFVKSPFGTNIKGGTGFSVRTFIRYLHK